MMLNLYLLMSYFKKNQWSRFHSKDFFKKTLFYRIEGVLVSAFRTRGVPGPTSKFVAACHCPDGLVRDGTQGENEPCIILHQGARSRGYKRCERARARKRVGESEREREGLVLPVFSRPFVVRLLLLLLFSWTSPFIDIRRWPSCTMGV
jgi:hypothetical protein